MIVRLAALVLVCGLAAMAQAQSVFTQGGDKPVEIEADNGIEWQRDAKAYVARGNARARRDGRGAAGATGRIVRMDQRPFSSATPLTWQYT